jgi:hypothetical protein
LPVEGQKKKENKRYTAFFKFFFLLQPTIRLHVLISWRFGMILHGKSDIRRFPFSKKKRDVLQFFAIKKNTTKKITQRKIKSDPRIGSFFFNASPPRLSKINRPSARQKKKS